MSLSTHVLDAALGRPAQGVRVVMSQRTAEGWTPLVDSATDADGRLRVTGGSGTDLEIPAGVFRLEFGTAEYFAANGQTGFYPEVVVTFEVTDPAAHHHVPLLLSPFAYSTYRGS